MILITTRTIRVVLKFIEARDVIVDLIIDLNVITLLKKKLDMTINNNDLRMLARILEYIPLTIVQAAAYI